MTENQSNITDAKADLSNTNEGLSTGVFITFEGGEGVGKSTHVKILAARLEAAGLDVEVMREPGGTKISELIRGILLDEANDDLVDRAELLLYQAARAQLVIERIMPALARGAVVLCDRYFDSTTAYQGFGRKMPLDLVEQANLLGSAGLVPMRTILLIDNWELALERARDLGSDRLESENLEFHRRVELGFDDVFRHNQDRIVKVQLQEQIWQTAELVFKAVKDLFGDKVSDVFVVPEELLV